MGKEQFLEQLSGHLKRLSEEERNDILYDYKEHFQFGIEEGKTEEQIVRELGSPRIIAKEILALSRLDEMEKDPSATNISRVVMAAVGLSLFNLIIVIGPLVAIAGVLLALWISSIAFILSPILAAIKMMVLQSFIPFDLFASIALLGIGLLLFVAAYYMSRAYKQFCVRYLQWNLKVMKGR
ncbi:hypothetical protein BAMA_15890 [Bacillus manliponensis]|uniref:DUF1700 domain-containing protein n=1 Tax=Bacillus manliponensis TaxID=574376 RepID=A0A073JSS9_9BACI|nr:DUF1700 domain-containing protein [Bacillus manliponensis]KEK17307.1 hypothetical protein BAMA_15890 [Bacillus manliponensis]